MNVEITYDPSALAAPPVFIAAVAAAVADLDATFLNPVTINIAVGYGELDGQPMAPSDVSNSLVAAWVAEPYSVVQAALVAGNAPGSATLPAVAPVALLEVPIAEAKALGLTAPSAALDGYIAISPQALAGGYDVKALVEHEITEDLGRVRFALPDVGTVLDLLSFSSPAVHATTPGPAYLSTDNGVTALASFNPSAAGGDLGDNAPGTPDAFSVDATPGATTPLTPVDVVEVAALIGGLTETVRLMGTLHGGEPPVGMMAL